MYVKWFMVYSRVYVRVCAYMCVVFVSVHVGCILILVQQALIHIGLSPQPYYK